MMRECPNCYQGKVADKNHPNFEEYDREWDRLYDTCLFNAYEVSSKLSKEYSEVMIECPKCNGTGKVES